MEQRSQKLQLASVTSAPMSVLRLEPLTECRDP